MTEYYKNIKELKRFINSGDYSQIVIIADENTAEYCLSFIVDHNLKYDHIIIIPAGEIHKNIDTCQSVWNKMTAYNLDRHALVINLGGGVVTDLGGYCAANYKRGIDFIHIPTSLLCMVDASIGGKTGIDYQGFKNQIGLFAQPQAIFVQPQLLSTLPQKEWVSGYAEIYKHALIQDVELFQELNKMTSINPTDSWENIIWRAIKIKDDIVDKDPLEKADRKALNFGHTIGHAIESHFLAIGHPIAHGHAVAIGMICESYLSMKRKFITESELAKVTGHLMQIFTPLEISSKDHDQLYTYCLGDKKNRNGQIRCTMIGPVGQYRIDHVIFKDDLQDALKFYDSLMS